MLTGELIVINRPEKIVREMADDLLREVEPRLLSYIIRTSGPRRPRGGSLRASRGRRWPVQTAHSLRSMGSTRHGGWLYITNRVEYARYVNRHGRGGSVIAYLFRQWARKGGMQEAVNATVKRAGRDR